MRQTDVPRGEHREETDSVEMAELDRPLRVFLKNDYPSANFSCFGAPLFTPTTVCKYPGWCIEVSGGNP